MDILVFVIATIILTYNSEISQLNIPGAEKLTPNRTTEPIKEVYTPDGFNEFDEKFSGIQFNYYVERFIKEGIFKK